MKGEVAIKVNEVEGEDTEDKRWWWRSVEGETIEVDRETETQTERGLYKSWRNRK